MIEPAVDTMAWPVASRGQGVFGVPVGIPPGRGREGLQCGRLTGAIEISRSSPAGRYPTPDLSRRDSRLNRHTSFPGGDKQMARVRSWSILQWPQVISAAS
jgi:hypothetical protein